MTDKKPAKREVKTPYQYRVVTKISLPDWLKTRRMYADVVAGVLDMQLVTAVRLSKNKKEGHVLEVELIAPAEDERMSSISEATRKVFERVQDLLKEAEALLQPKKT